MVESESKGEKQQKERRFDPELLKKGLRCDLDQYEMLLRCSEKRDMTEWNEWRKEHPDEDILLEGADFQGLYFKGVLFETKPFSIFSGEVNLENANFRKAHLEGANLRNANLKRTNFDHTHLEGADIGGSNLKNAYLYGARLEGTCLSYTYLKDANFKTAIVDGGTRFWRCKVSRDTDFRAVGLGNAMIAPETRQLLEYNIRRKNWEDWYKEHPKLKWVVKLFWLVSDYGLSTGRIIVIFFALAFVFAIIYYLWGLILPPGIVDNLFVDRNGIVVPCWLVPLRTLYFSIGAMTTLGFGDMYANAQSIWGHVLLMVQVILGYVLLGALVTRFAILFMAGGPAGKFADEKKEKPTEGTEENK